jgi:hypothetical protein
MLLLNLLTTPPHPSVPIDEEEGERNSRSTKLVERTSNFRCDVAHSNGHSHSLFIHSQGTHSLIDDTSVLVLENARGESKEGTGSVRSYPRSSGSTERSRGDERVRGVEASGGGNGGGGGGGIGVEGFRRGGTRERFEVEFKVVEERE